MFKKIAIIDLVLINLQIFANPNTNVTTDAALAPENKEFYDMTLLDNAKANLVHDQFGQERDIPANGGKTITFRRYSALPKATTPLTEGVTPDGSKLEVTEITSDVEQFGNYVTISDVLDLTGIDKNLVEATKVLGAQSGETLDTVTRDVLQQGTNVLYCSKVVNGVETEVEDRTALDATCKLTSEMVKRASTILKANNAKKIDGKYVAIIHPYAADDLTSDPAWIEVAKYGAPERIFENEIGAIHNVRFVESTEAKIYKGAEDDCPTGLAVFGTLFLGANAYGTTSVQGGGLETIIKQLGSGGTSDPLNQRATTGWKALKTAEILDESSLLRVESVSKWSSKVEAN